MEAKFKVGDQVTAVAFTDCFGEFHPEVPGLEVTEVKRYDFKFAPLAQFRVRAERDKSPYMIEGAERYFRPA